jgi:pyruvate-formate lyase-activating enzyme
MKKILCLGNNTEDTDVQTRNLSAGTDLLCHGLLSDLDSVVSGQSFEFPGYYHTSVYDIEFGKLLDICNKFDQVIILDQPVDQWSHPDAFYKTLQLASKISSAVKYANPKSKIGFDFFSELVQTNKSFCIFPFIELLVNFDFTTVCCRSNTPVTPVKDLSNFAQDKNYLDIRQKMLRGELITEHCSSCYKLEHQGIISARQQETVEWTNRLQVQSLEQLSELSGPAYYEIRPSNKCNLQCRMCNPNDSHLIQREYQQIGLIDKNKFLPKKNVTGFDIVDFSTAKKIYVAGGEPTIMTEFYDFLDQCIEHNRTDVEFLVNTNGTKLSERFKSQLKHFSNFHFVFSIDGFDRLNHYIRWPSKWQAIVSNLHYLRNYNHKVTVNTTVSIYNILSLNELFKFIDSEFPNTLIHCQIAENLSPFMFPDSQIALDSLLPIRSLNCYKNDVLFANSIDGYINHFQTRSTAENNLLDFFKFNDKLDQSRGVKLQDYVPELELYRV